ncbi:hypothetical protein ZOSMA_25G01220 [Zostera marina]|uniref:Uncharacterized protein n=1 Tax=Zostera marina TaxID=29655 RepID=A0A0K9PHM5_ZOSMR|nr:hypothetical protein ZOSMA_25G01220 [Zostera marina]
MSDVDDKSIWTTFTGIKSFAPSSSSSPNPEALMSEIDMAISSREYTHATSLLLSSSKSHTDRQLRKRNHDPRAVGLADEAYKTACAELAAGKPDQALKSLQFALLNCPLEKGSAVGKIKSMIAYASQQLKFRDQF